MNDPFLIEDVDDLMRLNTVNPWDIREGSQAFEGLYFKLDDDIDLSSVCSDVTKKSWTPIGCNGSFAGSFDGDGHSITGLYIDSDGLRGAYYYSTSKPNLRGGLFCPLADSAVISNLTVSGKIDLSVVKDDNEETGAGGISQENNGVIKFCISKVAIKGQNEAGGIVAENFGSIKDCENQGDVTAAKSGGIAAVLSGKGEIDCCFNRGRIRSEGKGNNEDISYASGAGGIVGVISSKGDKAESGVSNCYNIGKISGADSSVGGIEGYADGTLINCYNYGVISGEGTSKTGALFGVSSQSGLRTESCYYAAGSASQATGDGSTGGSSLSKDEFTEQSNFKEWNFESVWVMGTNRPVLAGLSDDGSYIPDLGIDENTVIVNNSKGQTVLVGDVGIFEIPGIDKASVFSKGKAGQYDPSTGKITTNKKGKLKLYTYITVNGKKKKKLICTLKIEQPKIKHTLSLKVGKVKRLKLTGTKTPVTAWESQDPDIATVYSNGSVAGMETGVTTVTAWIRNHSYICTVTVK